ncbi:immune inhibitor A domain-containing protein [Halioglobus japonicus]|nr:immune inhibitor A domain-containing protein [Halioglobus japonicus]
MSLRTFIAAGVAATMAVAVHAKPVSQDAIEMVDNLAGMKFDQLGHPQIASDSIQPALAPADKPHKLLILPVSFTDVGYDRFAGDPRQDEKNRAYFQELLFAAGPANPAEDTLSHYYRHASKGRYNITGDIFPVVKLKRTLSHYGRPVQTSDGQWRSDERASELVVDALKTAYAEHPDFPWSDYDQWDPQDFDGDGNRDEPDGYIDHFVMIVAGKGQSSCQGLYKLGEKLNPNASADAFDSLTPDEQACADRIWPHRFALQYNLDSGPEVDGVMNVRGGIELGDGLWVLDYNMQSEYTEVATFIHEFGHSLGLPDIYARVTNNSTAGWDVMSSTASPSPQEMSAWSRMVLGWMDPCVVRPQGFGGKSQGSLYLQTMNDWSGQPGATGDACDAAMVILPPKYREIELGPLTAANGKQAAYSGQGNDMNRSLSRDFDLTSVSVSAPLQLSMDLWFEIEAEWDYLYVEIAADGGAFERIMPMDKQDVGDKQSVMPSNKGHEGQGSIPGFTGLSGDLDGDNKVETAPACDPAADRRNAEDSIGDASVDPCSAAQWVTASFDLEAYRGKNVTLRITYFTDMAAAENGALVDNVAFAAVDFSDDFEAAELNSGWKSKGFTLSGGSHSLTVPHFYVLEYRDPYATFAKVKNYDQGLSHPGFSFFPNEKGEMEAVSANYRPGVVMWYYNGEYLWSQNDPAEFGPGKGFLLVVDSTPQEFRIPMMPDKYFQEQDGWTWWEFDDEAQPQLEKAFVDVMCFQRQPAFYSTDVSEQQRKACAEELNGKLPPVESISWDGRKLMYSYTIVNSLLPGEDRRARKSASSLFDLRIRQGKTQYRIYDRLLRSEHSADAPFSLQPYERGIEYYHAVDGEMQVKRTEAFAPVSEFTDAAPTRYQNPKLPFGSAAIPEAGFSYRLVAPDADAPSGTRVRIDYEWRKQ